MKLHHLILVTILLICSRSAQAAQQTPETIWTTAVTLAPGLGFWVAPEERSGTFPIGETSRYKTSVTGSGTLTWVVDFPQSGKYQVWTRQMGFPKSGIDVLVNEAAVSGGKGSSNTNGNQYTWFHVGETAIKKGLAHVDLVINQRALDAVLFTLDKDFQPEVGPLPVMVKSPILRAPRRYRNDSHLKSIAGAAGMVAGRMDDPYQQHNNDIVPSGIEVLDAVHLWGSPNQYVTATFSLRALVNASEVNIDLSGVKSPEWRLDSSHFELRVAQLRDRSIAAYSEHTALTGKGTIPDLLLRDDRTVFPPSGKQGGFGGGHCVTSIPAHESRQIWMTVQIPTYCPPGEFRGVVNIQVKGSKERNLSIPVVLNVLPIDLKPVDGYYGSFYRCSIDPKSKGGITSKQLLSDLQFQVMYGLNAATLYDGAKMIPYARQAGMTQPPVSMVPRTTDGGNWEDEARRQVAEAKAMGFPDLYFYGVDEAHTDDAVKLARSAGERSMKAGIHEQDSFMSPADYDKLKDVVSRPVMMMYNFNTYSAHNELVDYANQKGFQPISYWFSNASYPLRDRALVGLYNTACGYLGTAPWASQDYGDSGPSADYFYFYPDKTGEPIPTIRFEAYRQGIDDVRYLQAMDRAISSAEKILVENPENPNLQKALADTRLVRKTRFESITGGYIGFVNSITAKTLEETRKEMAEATININNSINK